MPATDLVIAAGLLLRRETGAGRRWLLLRARNGEWGFPKGHMEAGETELATALRECAEETGIALVAIDGPPMELRYHLPDGRDKRVVYFPAVTASEQVALSDEHRDFRWADAEDVLDLLRHANVRAMFRAHRAGLA